LSKQATRFFRRDELSYFHFAAMDVFVMIDELSAESVGSTFNSSDTARTLVMALKTFPGFALPKCSGEIMVCHDSAPMRTRPLSLPVVLSLRKLPLTSMLHAFEQLRSIQSEGKTYMGKTDFRFAVFCEDIKDNVGTSSTGFCLLES